MSVHQGRVYDERRDEDGTRVLVDRLWPRGLHRDDPRIDAWVKNVAPSTELRRWYAHQPDRLDEFRERYRQELAQDGPAAEAFDDLCARASRGTLTLLTATRDVAASHLPTLVARVAQATRDAPR